MELRKRNLVDHRLITTILSIMVHQAESRKAPHTPLKITTPGNRRSARRPRVKNRHQSLRRLPRENPNRLHIMKKDVRGKLSRSVGVSRGRAEGVNPRAAVNQRKAQAKTISPPKVEGVNPEAAVSRRKAKAKTISPHLAEGVNPGAAVRRRIAEAKMTDRGAVVAASIEVKRG